MKNNYRKVIRMSRHRLKLCIQFQQPFQRAFSQNQQKKETYMKDVKARWDKSLFSQMKNKHKFLWAFFDWFLCNIRRLWNIYFKKAVQNISIYLNLLTAYLLKVVWIYKKKLNSTLRLFQFFRRLMDLYPGKVL